MARPSVERSVGSQPEGSNFRQPSASGGLDREHAGEATRDELARDLVIHLVGRTRDRTHDLGLGAPQQQGRKAVAVPADKQRIALVRVTYPVCFAHGAGRRDHGPHSFA